MSLASVGQICSSRFENLAQTDTFDWDAYVLSLDVENLSSWNLFSFPKSSLDSAIEALASLEKRSDAQKYSNCLQVMLMGLEAKRQDYTSMLARFAKLAQSESVLMTQFTDCLRDHLTKQGSCRPDYRLLVGTLTASYEKLSELQSLEAEAAIFLKKNMEGLLDVDYNPDLTKFNSCLIDTFFAIPDQAHLLSLFSAINASESLGYGIIGERIVKQPTQLKIALLTALVKHASNTTLESAKFAIANIALGTIKTLGKNRDDYLNFFTFFKEIEEFNYEYEALLITAYKERAAASHTLIDAKKTKWLDERYKKLKPEEMHSGDYYFNETFADFCKPKVGLENQTVIDEHVLSLLEGEVGDPKSRQLRLDDLDMLLASHINVLKMQLADLDSIDLDVALNNNQDAFATIILRSQFQLAIGALDDAAANLDAVLPHMEDTFELPDEGKNLVYSARAYIHGQKEEYSQALEFFKKALSREGARISADSISKGRFLTIYSRLGTPAGDWQALKATLTTETS